MGGECQKSKSFQVIIKPQRYHNTRNEGGEVKVGSKMVDSFYHLLFNKLTLVMLDWLCHLSVQLVQSSCCALFVSPVSQLVKSIFDPPIIVFTTCERHIRPSNHRFTTCERHIRPQKLPFHNLLKPVVIQVRQFRSHFDEFNQPVLRF